MSVGLWLDASLGAVCLGLYSVDPVKGRGPFMAWEQLQEQKGSLQFISAVFARLLDNAGLHVHDVSELWVSSGPGTFTGIRGSLAFCYGLWDGHSALNCFAFSATELLCFALAKQQKLAQSGLLLAATQQKGYLSSYQAATQELQSVAFALGDPLPATTALWSMGEWAPALPEAVTNAGNYHGHLSMTAAYALAQEYFLAFLQEHPTPYALAPRYLRESTVEERLAGKGP